MERKMFGTKQEECCKYISELACAEINHGLLNKTAIKKKNRSSSLLR
jgi:hypothetical protein